MRQGLFWPPASWQGWRGWINRKNMIPGDLTLQEGEAREYTRKLTKKKKIIFIEKKAP